MKFDEILILVNLITNILACTKNRQVHVIFTFDLSEFISMQKWIIDFLSRGDSC